MYNCTVSQSYGTCRTIRGRPRGSSVAKLQGHVHYQLGVLPYHWRCAPPTLNNYTSYHVLRDQYMTCLWWTLNLHGQIERAMLTLSGQLTSGVARHGPSRARPDLLVTYHAYLIPFHEVLYRSSSSLAA